MIYLDSSVALADLLGEPRSPPDSLWAGPLVSGKLLEYEVWNRVHAYVLTASHSDDARTLLMRVVLMEMSEKILWRALEPFPISVRTLDALHLATMEYIRSRAQPVELASYDDRLLAGAQSLGIPIAAL